MVAREIYRSLTISSNKNYLKEIHISIKLPNWKIIETIICSFYEWK